MQIRNADTQQLDEQMTLLESKRLELSLELDVSFKYAIADYRHKLRDNMRKKAAELLHETETGIESRRNTPIAKPSPSKNQDLVTGLHEKSGEEEARKERSFAPKSSVARWSATSTLS